MILTIAMAHPRKLIRHAVVALLLAANTAAAARVKPTRVEPNKTAALPALGVYTLNDPVDPDRSTPHEDVHELELEIVGWVGHTQALSVDDAMDDLAEQVEAAMVAELANVNGPFLGGKVFEARLVGTTMQVVEENGRTDPNVGVVVLTYAMTYRSSLAAPDPTEDFLSVDAKHRVNGVGEGNQANDIFVVQENPP